MWFSKEKQEPSPEALSFDWSTEEHSVGVALFDREHQHLADLVCQLQNLVHKQRDRLMAQALLEGLIQEARLHFDHEEGVMANTEFPGREAHVAEHLVLIEQAKELLLQVQEGRVSIFGIPNFLSAWLLDHIHTTDRKYSAWLRRHGLQ